MSGEGGQAEADPLKTGPYEKRFSTASEGVPRFDGKQPRLTKPWLGSIEDAVAIYGIRPEHKAFMAVTALDGVALEWWYDYKASREQPFSAATLSFEDFSVAISARFAVAPELDARDRLIQMAPARGEDPAAFSQRFTQLASEAQPPVDALTLVFIYLNKLPRAVQQRVRTSAPAGGRFQELAAVQSAALAVWTATQLADLQLGGSDSETGSDQSTGSKRKRTNGHGAGPSRFGQASAGPSEPPKVVAGRSGDRSFLGTCNKCGNKGHKRSDCPDLPAEPKN